MGILNTKTSNKIYMFMITIMVTTSIMTSKLERMLKECWPNEAYSPRDDLFKLGERGYSLIWLIWGCATGQGIVFGLFVVNRVYNFLGLS